MRIVTLNKISEISGELLPHCPTYGSKLSLTVNTRSKELTKMSSTGAPQDLLFKLRDHSSITTAKRWVGMAATSLY